MNDSKKGLEHRYIVRRLDDSSDPGGKHAVCQYFVLDMDHDPHALTALLAYAESCKGTHPLLSHDLQLAITEARKRQEKHDDQ